MFVELNDRIFCMSTGKKGRNCSWNVVIWKWKIRKHEGVLWQMSGKKSFGIRKSRLSSTTVDSPTTIPAFKSILQIHGPSNCNKHVTDLYRFIWCLRSNYTHFNPSLAIVNIQAMQNKFYLSEECINLSYAWNFVFFVTNNITNTSLLTLFREIISSCCNSHTKHKYSVG